MQSRAPKAVARIASASCAPVRRNFTSARDDATLLEDVEAGDDGSSKSITKPLPLSANHIRRNNRPSLPLSTYFDPGRISQRRRHRNPKPPPPKYASLDPFRQRIAVNPYARLLASPVRRDEVTRARLPSSFLIKFHPVKDPRGQTSSYTPIPLDLYSKVNPKWRHTDVKEGTEQKTSYLNRAAHLPLRGPVYNVRSSKSEKDQEAMSKLDPTKAHSTMPSGTGLTVSVLLRQQVLAALAWLMKHAKSDIQPLGVDGLGYDENGVPLSLHNVQHVVAIIYFGGRTRTRQLLELEKRAAAIQKATATILSRSGKLEKALKDLGIEKAVGINPRATAPELELSTVSYRFVGALQSHEQSDDTWTPSEYRIPVFNMVDILGEEKAQELLNIGQHDDSKWFCIKEGRVCANALDVLHKAAWWFQEADFLEDENIETV